MDLLTQLLKPAQAIITSSFQAMHATCSFANCKNLVAITIASSLGFVFVFGSAVNSASCMVSLSMLVPACVLEIKSLLLKLEEKDVFANSAIDVLNRIESNAARFVAILCILSFTLSAMRTGVPMVLQLTIFGIYYFNMIYPHSKLPELPLDSFLCCIISFFVIYVFFCSKAFKTYICSLVYAILSSFGLLSLLHRNIAAGDGIITDFFFLSPKNTLGYAFHVMVCASMLFQYLMRTALGVKRCLMSRINNETLDK